MKEKRNKENIKVAAWRSESERNETCERRKHDEIIESDEENVISKNGIAKEKRRAKMT